MPSVPTRKSRRFSFGCRFVAVAFILTSAQTTPALAAKVYRCGNAFQDQPCPEPKPAQQRPGERPATSRDAAPCSSLGKDANGRDCLVRASARDTQAAAAAAKR